MKKKFALLPIPVLLVLFFAGCQPAAKFEDPAKPTAPAKTAIRVSDPETDSAETAVAADPDGNLYVVFVEHDASKREADIYLRRFDNQAVPVGEKTRVNSEKGMAKAWFGDPPTIKISADKAVFIGWTAKIAGAEKGSATDLFLSVSRDGGKTFDKAVKINDDTAPASHGMHSLEVDKSNRVFVAWLDERNINTEAHPKTVADENQAEPEFQFIKALHDSNHKPAEIKKPEPKHEMIEPNSEVFFASSSDGGKTFSANKQLSGDVCPCCKTSLVATTEGRLFLSWRQVLPGDFRHIAVASSIDAGQNFSPAVIVNDDQWQINACPVSGAPLSIGKDNALNVVWYSGGKAGKTGLQSARSTDGGKSFSQLELLYEGVVKGTSEIFAGTSDRIFFESNQKLFQTLIEPGKDSETKEIGEGELPAVVSYGGTSFVCFIKKEDKKRGVWLIKVSNDN